MHDEPTARRLLDAFGPEGLRVELQRPYARHDRARNRALAALARRLGVACVATGDVHAHARSARELQDAFVALRHRTTLDASEPLRRGNHSHVLSRPRGDGQPLRRPPRGGARDAAPGRAAALRPDAATSATATRGPRTAELRRARLAELVPGAPGGERYGQGSCGARASEQGSRRGERRGDAREAAARLEEELRVIDELGLAGFFLLHHEMLELAREVAARGARARTPSARCWRPVAGGAPRSPRSSAT